MFSQQAVKKIVLACWVILAFACSALASDGSDQPSLPQVELKIGHTRLVKLPRKIQRVSVGKPEICDVVVINTHQLYLNGKSPGSTNITLWAPGDKLIGMFMVRVERDLSLLKQRMHQVLPDEPVEIRELQGTVVLSGRVSSEEAKKRAKALAYALVPRKDLAESMHNQLKIPEYVIDLLEVGAVKQVALKVRFAEVRRDALKRLKVNLGFRDLACNFFNTFLGGVTGPLLPSEKWDLPAVGPGFNPFSRPPYDLGLSNKTTIAGGFTWGGDRRIMGFLDVLKENGLAKILAEPNLVAASGQEADFLAGGEFPIPVPQRENITILFKNFGVRLRFKPTVLSNGKIRMEVEPEVSELDFSTAVVISGYVVPGLTTRRAKTQLDLDTGQNFGMAGMFRDDLSQVVSKIPLLGDIPILGVLFRSTEFQHKKTELVIAVTPEIVTPGYGAPSLPTDNLKMPSEWDLYMGKMVEMGGKEGAKGAGVPRSPKELEGRFGHALPF
ncbi:MAG: type II and III secretion system protein family protein [Pseudomonadota bacterium]